MILHLHKLVAILLASAVAGQNTISGEAVTERYWDCCKTDCAWPGHADVNQPSAVCDARNNPLTDPLTSSSCGDGDGYACADQSPWAVNDTFSYGYAGVFLMGRAQDAWCCACYELTFTSGRVAGKKMVLQAHNAGFDLLTANRFTLAIPGGNTSFAGACSRQYGLPNSVFGEPLEGVGSIEDCDNLPDILQEGCRWRFDWFENEARPSANYTRVQCPTILTNRTGCIRNDEAQFGPSGAASTTASFTMLGLAALLVWVFNGGEFY